MDKIKIKNIFVAVFEKKNLDPMLALFANSSFSSLKPGFEVRFWGTEGTIRYVKSQGFKGESVVSGFDFDGRVKSLDRSNFVRILADRTKHGHVSQLKKEKLEPIDLVVVDLYAPNPKIFPESIDIGGQSLIRSAIKNYKNVALAFDEVSINSLVGELVKNSGATTLAFRKQQAKKAAKFIAERCRLEAKLFENS